MCTSQLKANAELYLEASYYNIRTDSWEPILEPVVDPQNESQYVSWGVKARVVRQPPNHVKHHTEECTWYELVHSLWCKCTRGICVVCNVFYVCVL